MVSDDKIERDGINPELNPAKTMSDIDHFYGGETIVFPEITLIPSDVATMKKVKVGMMNEYADQYHKKSWPEGKDIEVGYAFWVPDNPQKGKIVYDITALSDGPDMEMFCHELLHAMSVNPSNKFESGFLSPTDLAGKNLTESVTQLLALGFTQNTKDLEDIDNFLTQREKGERYSLECRVLITLLRLYSIDLDTLYKVYMTLEESDLKRTLLQMKMTNLIGDDSEDVVNLKKFLELF